MSRIYIQTCLFSTRNICVWFIRSFSQVEFALCFWRNLSLLSQVLLPFSMEPLPPHPPGESVGHMVITICVVFGVVTAIAMSLRLFTRFWIIGTIGLDDSKKRNPSDQIKTMLIYIPVLMTIAAVRFFFLHCFTLRSSKFQLSVFLGRLSQSRYFVCVHLAS
jgi:uncharacterized membrane protein YwzB